MRIGKASQRNKLKVLSHDRLHLETSRLADESAAQSANVGTMMWANRAALGAVGLTAPIA
jgi:hypothetical protein